jgi:hypothetical protein
MGVLIKNNTHAVNHTQTSLTKFSSVLFIHPRTEMMVPEILPLSLPALINRLPSKCIGRFYNEWTEAEVKHARIIIIDVHWYLGLTSAIELAHSFKRINHEIKLIAGGLTASIFAGQLLRDAPIDYVICGDAEIPLSQLVSALLEERPVTNIPNLIGRDFRSTAKYALTTADLDENNFVDISFFPKFKKRILAYHRIYNTRVPITIPVYPYLVIFRGCPLACPVCSGSTKLQSKLMGRNWVLRSADKVEADLNQWSNDERIKFVNILHDFITILPLDYTRKALSEKYSLNVYYEFFGQPGEEALDLLLQAFNGGKLSFSLDDCHGTTSKVTNPDGLIARIRQAQAHGRYKIVLSYVGRFLRNPEYLAALRKVQNLTGVALNRVDWWWENDYKHFLSQSQRYRTVNFAFRVGVAGYRLWPRLFQAISQRLWAFDVRNLLYYRIIILSWSSKIRSKFFKSL